MAGHIVVGVNGSVPSRAAVEWAADDALRLRAPLRVVHAFVPGSRTTWMRSVWRSTRSFATGWRSSPRTTRR
ncbi:universal stress protein [Nonomuraea fuscirosea]|uniref:universal stress protein n=1 Tax=Nonomuraea fuscirosea TaxID=1291556 RepID=UPI0033F0CBBE